MTQQPPVPEGSQSPYPLHPQSRSAEGGTSLATPPSAPAYDSPPSASSAGTVSPQANRASTQAAQSEPTVGAQEAEGSGGPSLKTLGIAAAVGAGLALLI